MKFALAGVGKWGKNYIKTFQNMRGHDLIACHSRTTPPQISTEYLPWFNNLDELLKLDFDTLIVATPPDTHYEISRKAMLARKHVICEKPCIMDKYELDGLSRPWEWDAPNTVFFTNYINQFTSQTEAMRISIRDNAFSSVNLVNVGNGPERDYSSLWDYGCHEIFLAMYINDSREPKIIDYHKYDEKHFLTLGFARSHVNIVVGSGFDARVNSKTCVNKEGIISWHDEKKEPLLQRMLESFAVQPSSNTEYSKAIADVMKHL